jgi:hypothetical protein
LNTISARTEPVEIFNFAAKRHSHEPTTTNSSASERHTHVRREPRAQAIGDSRSRIRLMNRERHFLVARGEIRRGGNVPAETDDDVDVTLANDRADLGDSTPKSTGKSQRGRVRPSGKRHAVNREQFVAACRDESRLEPLARSEHEYRRAGLVGSETVCNSKKRIDVAGGSPAGQQVRCHR